MKKTKKKKAVRRNKKAVAPMRKVPDLNSSVYTFGVEKTTEETIITIPNGLNIELSWKNKDGAQLDFGNDKAVLTLAKGINLLLRLGDNQIRIPKNTPVLISILTK